MTLSPFLQWLDAEEEAHWAFLESGLEPPGGAAAWAVTERRSPHMKTGVWHFFIGLFLGNGMILLLAGEPTVAARWLGLGYVFFAVVLLVGWTAPRSWRW